MIVFFDFFLSLIGILVFSPLYLFIASWIKFDSRGPIFYRQKRIGKDGKEFVLFKFRTMQIDSDRNGLLTIGDKDNRITKCGIFIRKYKLDEIPQLINVLKGDMSLVGPRPEVKKYVDCYTKEQFKVLSIKPGITDFASIEFSNENKILEEYANPEEAYINIILPKKISYNLIYIQNRSLKNYFKIIFLTIWKILKK